MDDNKNCGFIAIIGATNSGKSTLMNTILDRHASIVSHKVQTTRNQIRGIKNYGNTQLVFIDTPGIFDAKNRFDKSIVKSAIDSVTDCDVIILLIDSVKGINKHVVHILDILKQLDLHKANSGLRIFAALNKIDLVNKLDLLKLTDDLNKLFIFDDIFMISAYKNDGVEDLVRACIRSSPKSNWFYLSDTIALPDNVYYAEITREQIYKFLHKELPYDISVLTESIKNIDNVTEIYQTVYVSRISQRKIVIGDNASVIKLIGSRSRKILQGITKRKIRLFLNVKVQEDWKNKKEFYDEIGLEFNV